MHVGDELPLVEGATPMSRGAAHHDRQELRLRRAGRRRRAAWSGVITDGDLRRHLGRPTFWTRPARDEIMTPGSPKTIATDAAWPAQRACGMMNSSRPPRHQPVRRRGREARSASCTSTTACAPASPEAGGRAPWTAPLPPPTTGPRGSPPWGARRGGARYSALRHARRVQPVFVVLMKLLLPTVALLLVGLIVVWPHLRTTCRHPLPASASPASAGARGPATRPCLQRPRYVGTDRKGSQPYLGDRRPGQEPDQRAEDAEVVRLRRCPRPTSRLEDGTWLVLSDAPRRPGSTTARPTTRLELESAPSTCSTIRRLRRWSTERATRRPRQGRSPWADRAGRPDDGPFGDAWRRPRASGSWRTRDGDIVFTGQARMVLRPLSRAAVGKPTQ